LNCSANRLVVAHGLLDENVHFLHTARLVEALVRANKPYVLKVSNLVKSFRSLTFEFLPQLFPEERHGLRKSTSSSYFYNFVGEFLEQNL
jgi:dipeptidyl-peptidase 9